MGSDVRTHQELQAASRLTLGFQPTYKCSPISALVALMCRFFSRSLFFWWDCNSRGELHPQARALGDSPAPLTAWATASWALGWGPRNPAPSHRLHLCRGTRPRDSSAPSPEKRGRNFVEESAPLFMERFEDEDKTYAHIRSAKLNQLVTKFPCKRPQE